MCPAFGHATSRLGLQVTGGNYRWISTRIRYAGIDTSHFQGRGWNRGQTKLTNPTLARMGRQSRISDEEVFVENSRMNSGSRVAARLLQMGWSYKCKWCGIDDWRGQPLVLHLDHI